MKLVSTLLIVSIFLFISQSALFAQSRYYVNASSLPGGNGLAWNTAFDDLQNALDAACGSQPAEIWVAAGIYYPSQNVGDSTSGAGDRSNTFALCGQISLYGGFAGTESDLAERDWINNKTILSGNINPTDTVAENAYNVVSCLHENKEARVDGFTIEDGHADTPDENGFNTIGGGIYVSNSHMVIAHCNIQNNRAIYGGGGIYADSSTVNISDCTFYHNEVFSDFSDGGGMTAYRSSVDIAQSIFADNKSSYSGGGIYLVESFSTLTDCSFTTDSSRYGGAVAIYSIDGHGVNTFSRCVFTNNDAYFAGGAIFNNRLSNTSVIDCDLIGNMAGDGGAISNEEGAKLTLHQTRLLENKSMRGGALFNYSGSIAHITNSRIEGNEAVDEGGGILNFLSILELRNSMITGNLAQNRGGGLILEESTTKIFNSTISGNKVLERGGGIGSYSENRLLIYNSIIWNNLAADHPEDYASSIYHFSDPFYTYFGHSLIEYSGGSNNWLNSIGIDLGNNLDVDPLFVEDVDINSLPNLTGDMHLQSNSPAINQGLLDTTKLYLPSVDAEGNPRIINGRIDLGALEYQDVSPFPLCLITGQDSVISGSVALFTAPLGMSSYTWSVIGNGVLSTHEHDLVAYVNTGYIGDYLIVLEVTDTSGNTTACSKKVTIDPNCSIWENATTLYVKPNVPVPGNGLSWDSAFPDLVDVLKIPCIDDKQIWVAAGTYYPTDRVLDQDATFKLRNSIALYGGFEGSEFNLEDRDVVENPTILSGNIDHDAVFDGNVFHVVTSIENDSSAILDGFVIEGGASMIINAPAYYNSGGGIMIQNSLPSIKYCTISGNTAIRGAGIWNDNSSPLIENCSISNNAGAVFGSGAGMANENLSAPRIKDCFFIGNLNSGGMFNSNSSPVLQRCLFNGNTVRQNGRGAGMTNSNASPKLFQCDFSDHTITGGGSGGAMYNAGGSIVEMEGCVFEVNKARRGAAMNNRASVVIMNGCRFSGNETPFDGDGGAIYCDNGTSLSVTNTVFENNFAYNRGGALYLLLSELEGSGNVYRRNNGFDRGGGAIYLDQSTGHLTQDIYEDNFSFHFGGAINVAFNSNLDLQESTFVRDTAIRGGAVHVNDTSNAQVQNCRFHHNYSQGNAGAIGVFGDCAVNIENCHFTHNLAGNHGGAMSMTSQSKVSVVNSVMMNNTAGQNAGAIYSERCDSARFVNTTFSGNTAILEGGVYAGQENSNVDFVNCILWNNVATGSTSTSSSSVFHEEFSNAFFTHNIIANSGGSQNWNPFIGEDQGNNLDADPLFVEPVDIGLLPDSTGDLHLLEASPAINAGTPDTTGLGIPSLDLDGNARIIEDRIDLGAYEYPFIVKTKDVENPFVNVSLYPNPTTDFITIQGALDQVDIEIVDLEGKILRVISKVSLFNGHSIELNSLSAGVYTLRINKDKEMIGEGRFVKLSK